MTSRSNFRYVNELNLKYVDDIALAEAIKSKTYLLIIIDPYQTTFTIELVTLSVLSLMLKGSH